MYETIVDLKLLFRRAKHSMFGHPERYLFYDPVASYAVCSSCGQSPKPWQKLR